ncbi:MAG: hypothetical protein HUU15_02310 [Candidatus Brocadiae bacterium]|nr:hypothetical protein [Candidatus Brocadiia bacterium]
MLQEFKAGAFAKALKSCGRDTYFILRCQPQRAATILLHRALAIAGAAVLRSRAPASRDLARLFLIASVLPGFGGRPDRGLPDTSLAMKLCSRRDAGLVCLFAEILALNPFFDSRATKQLRRRVLKSGTDVKSLLRALEHGRTARK